MDALRLIFWKWIAPRWLTYVRLQGWKSCGYACEWVASYGFVPEAGCPVHDR